MSEQGPANLEAMSDLCTPWCIHVVATLGIAGFIDGGTDKIDDLAAAAQCDPNVLHCVLGHLVSKGLFLEPEAGRFSLNEAAQGLLDPGTILALDLNGIGGRMAYSWSTLLKYARTGTPAYREVFGLPFWEDLDKNPEVAATFDALMGPLGHGAPRPDFDIIGGWEQVRNVVDVGGGTGAMLAEILRARPKVRGILVDLPNTVARSGETFRAAGVGDRVTRVGQSFFDPLPSGADLYVVRHVLHDWADRGAVALLTRCAEAARPAGRVVVLGGVQPEGASKRLTIEMLLCGGKNRTVSEFAELAGQSGLEVSAAGYQPSGYFVVECHPV